MRLLINSASTFKGGGVQVAKSFIEECKGIPENTYHVILGIKLAAQIEIASFPNNFTFSTLDYRPAEKVKTPFSSDPQLTKIEKEFQPHIVFTTTGPSYTKFKAPHLVGYNLPHYIYADSPFFKSIPLWKKLRWQLKGLAIKHFYKRDATAIVSQTVDVAQKAGDWLSIKKTFTVSNTCNNYFREKLKSKTVLNEKKKFRLLVLSSYHHHKNFQIINKITKLLEDNNIGDVEFVLTLDTTNFDAVFSETAKKYILNIGPVPSHEAPYLYREVDALFQPSLLECFSANFPEAMQMEKPIISTDLSFAKGVCGNAALYFSATNANHAYKKIIQLMEDATLRETLIANGKIQLTQFLSASERAKAYLKICNRLLATK